MISEKSQIQTIENTGGRIGVPSARPLILAVREDSAKSLLIALWFALVTSLTELSILVIEKVFLKHYIDFSGRYTVWMTPLADIFLFTTLALILILLSRQWPRLVSLRSAVFLFCLLAFSAVLLMSNRLNNFATLLLAAGLATQAARFIGAHGKSFYRLVLRTTPFLIALFVVLALGMWAWETMADRRAQARVPTSRPNAPNVLLIVLDAVRARNLSLYGYARQTTPRLEQLAKTSIVFDKAMSTAPWTLPSHATMFTGHYPHELSVSFTSGLDSTYPTLAEVLDGQGYRTAGFVANIPYCGPASGLSRGFTHYEDQSISVGQIIMSSSIGRKASDSELLRRLIGYTDDPGRKTAEEINGSFLNWLSRKDPQVPFFAFLNYFDAHEPYLPPPPYDERFGTKKPRPNPRHHLDWNWSASEIQTELDAYDGSINYLDHHVGLLIDELQKRGLLENTVVIITSDHGEEFSEHGIMDHGYDLYLPVLHVPLIISYAKAEPSGIRIKEPVSLQDLPATVLDLLNLKTSANLPGKSLSKLWNSTTPSSDSEAEPLLSELEFTPDLPNWYPVSKGNMKSLMTENYHYIRNGDNHEELYDLQKDPLEKNDLAQSADARQTLERFRATLRTRLKDESAYKSSAHKTSSSDVVLRAR